MKRIDCRAFKCPHPVVETRKLLLEEPGASVTVLVGDDTAKENVSRLASTLGYTVATESTEGGFSLTLTPSMKRKEATPATKQGKTVVFITADVLGGGNDELGRILLKNFIFTLAESGTFPDTLLFVNAGVKLAVEGSEVLEALEKLACQGTDIASCGLCLDFYNLKEKLAVGRVGNMLETVESLTEADRIVRL